MFNCKTYLHVLEDSKQFHNWFTLCQDSKQLQTKYIATRVFELTFSSWWFQPQLKNMCQIGSFLRREGTGQSKQSLNKKTFETNTYW